MIIKVWRIEEKYLDKTEIDAKREDYLKIELHPDKFACL